jgi:anti-sigma regulatory factor (Ser/Thr protein kinase)
VLALRLLTDRPRGSLNLYAGLPHAFGAVDRAKGVIFATHASSALGAAEARAEDAAESERHLQEALASRGIIGQAQGILMERERITAEQAFEILRHASQDLNVKLRDVAQRLVDTGEDPRPSPSTHRAKTDRAPVPRSSAATNSSNG